MPLGGQFASIVAGATTGLVGGLLFPLIKDVGLEAWKRWMARRVDDATIRVAEIEVGQDREKLVNANIWQFVEELKEQISKLEERVQTAEQRADAAQAEVEQLQAQLKSLRTITAENTRLRNKVKTLQMRVDLLQKELDGYRIPSA